jgi:hypothetical protein
MLQEQNPIGGGGGMGGGRRGAEEVFCVQIGGSMYELLIASAGDSVGVLTGFGVHPI